MAILFIFNYMFRLSVSSSSDSVNAHLPGCSFEYWMEPSDSFVSGLDSPLKCSTGEFQALQLIVLVIFGVLDLPLASCMLVHFLNQVWNDSGFLSLTQWRTTFSLFSISCYILLPHNMMILYCCLPYCNVPNSALVLYSTSGPSFYKDVVLTLSIRTPMASRLSGHGVTKNIHTYFSQKHQIKQLLKSSPAPKTLTINFMYDHNVN